MHSVRGEKKYKIQNTSRRYNEIYGSANVYKKMKRNSSIDRKRTKTLLKQITNHYDSLGTLLVFWPNRNLCCRKNDFRIYDYKYVVWT